MPVAYAKIWKEKSLYKTADSTGVFVVDAKEREGYFKITCIGYHDTIALIAPEIMLRPKVVDLAELKLAKCQFEKQPNWAKPKEETIIMVFNGILK